MEPDELSTEAVERAEAIARIKKRRDFHGHVLVYVLVNAAVWVIWATTGSGYPWPAWLSGAWAIGLITNFWDVYIRKPIADADVKHEIDRVHPEHAGIAPETRVERYPSNPSSSSGSSSLR